MLDETQNYVASHEENHRPSSPLANPAKALAVLAARLLDRPSLVRLRFALERQFFLVLAVAVSTDREISFIDHRSGVQAVFEVERD